MVASSIFGASLILLYAASTLYHSIPVARAKAVLRVLDHSAIYLLIAGTYTPFTLVSLHGAWGWFASRTQKMPDGELIVTMRDAAEATVEKLWRA